MRQDVRNGSLERQRTPCAWGTIASVSTVPEPHMQRRFIVALFALAASQLTLAQNQAPELPSGWTPKKAVRTRQDMGAASDPLAVRAGDQARRAGLCGEPALEHQHRGREISHAGAR